MRCFISADFPDEVKKELYNIQKEIPEAKLKLVKPENMHLTLKFLGDIKEEDIDKIKEILREIKTDIRGRIEKIGIFTPSAIRVIWVSVEPEEKLKEIHDKLDEKLEEIGFKKDKEWKSHATLARMGRINDKKEFLIKLSGIKIKKIEFNVDEIKLKKSVLTPKGPVYEDL